MELKLFKTLWGFEGSYVDAARLAREQGYDGIEGPVPKTDEGVQQLATSLQQNDLAYIAEVATTGTIIPDRRLPPEAHLNDLQDNILRMQSLKPLFISCLGGCDAWEISESISFLRKAVDSAEQAGLAISFETHRGRIFFNPWITQRIIQVLPNLKLTCDFSHWCVVCEGLQETEADIIRALSANAWHIHGRVGYDQGPQVPDPRAALYFNDLEKHYAWWRWIWDEHVRQEKTITTVTPEFGRDGYEYRDTGEGLPLVDIGEINHWLAQELRFRFQNQPETTRKVTA